MMLYNVMESGAEREAVRLSEVSPASKTYW